MSESLRIHPLSAPSSADLSAVVARLDAIAAGQEQLVALFARIADRAAPPPPDEFLDAGQVAELLGVSLRSVRTWEHTGDLPKATKLGRLKKWRRAEIVELLKKRQEKRRP